MNNQVAKAYNRFSDRAFIKALAEHDHAVRSEIAEKSFYSGLDVEEQGKHLYIMVNFRVTFKCAMDRAEE